MDSTSAATYANERSNPIEDYCSTGVFAEKETEKITSILILRLMTVTDDDLNTGNVSIVASET